MFILIIAILGIGFGLYYITTIDFEVGDGFSEEKKGARDVDYKVTEKEEVKNLLN
ncbi:MAG: hypothetical protein ISR98_02095 [Parcubacteria group bacterium]|nr:hypothetical protein [Parcubacteria group bacterium]